MDSYKRHLCNDFTAVVACGLHYSEHTETVMHLLTAEEMSAAIDGGVERYVKDALFHAKVDAIVFQLMGVACRYVDEARKL